MSTAYKSTIRNKYNYENNNTNQPYKHNGMLSLNYQKKPKAIRLYDYVFFL